MWWAQPAGYIAGALAGVAAHYPCWWLLMLGNYVFSFVSTGTIEEKVMELKARKAALFSSVMDADDALTGALDADDIRALIDLPS